MEQTCYLQTAEILPFLDPAKLDHYLFCLPVERAARIRSPRSVRRRAERAAADHALTLICRTAGIPRSAVRLCEEASGKPRIAGREDLTISISHSGNLAAVALMSGTPAPQIGLDIQKIAPVRDPAALAARFLSPRLAESVHQAPPESVSDALIAAWTLAEATVKLTGAGIGAAKTADPVAMHCGCYTDRVTDGWGQPYRIAMVAELREKCDPLPADDIASPLAFPCSVWYNGTKDNTKGVFL